LPFNYITFAANWTGLFHVIAVDYERYIIFSLQPYSRHKRKSMPIGCW